MPVCGICWDVLGMTYDFILYLLVNDIVYDFVYMILRYRRHVISYVGPKKSYFGHMILYTE